MQIPSIKSVRVYGLHDQFNLELELKPTLNIIYGKNGKGKTTLLHILANALEQDFHRFALLRFGEIRIETHSGSTLQIKQRWSVDAKHATEIFVEIDGQPTTVVSPESDLSAIERSTLADRFGPRAVYLPAFRGILERFDRESAVRHAAGSSTTTDFQKVLSRERQHQEMLSEKDLASFDVRYDRDRLAEATAYKTVQCREWFGATVPVIRYPSLSEVAGQLVSEWRYAKFQVVRAEDEMFSESFARVFETIIGTESHVGAGNFDSLLSQLSNTIPKLESSGESSRTVFERVSHAVKSMKAGVSIEEATAKRVLGLYVEMMEKRAATQQSAFQRIREFEQSVNVFLDGKRLQIVQDGGPRRYAPRVVITPIGTERRYPVHSLSSGERQVVSMLFSASRLAMNQGIFLVDEPELSLHIDWQRSILTQLILQADNRQIIACTHSPEVGAEHRDAVIWFDPVYDYNGEDTGGSPVGEIEPLLE